jgi:glycyl-tRNA synthetase
MKKQILKQSKKLKSKDSFWDAFNEQEFVTTNPRVMEYKAREREILERLGRLLVMRI